MVPVTFSWIAGRKGYRIREGQQSPNCHCISCAILAQLYVILSIFYNFANYDLHEIVFLVTFYFDDQYCLLHGEN